MSKDKLLKHSREMADKIHVMQIKIKRLEEYQREMSTVGSNTDSTQILEIYFNNYIKD